MTQDTATLRERGQIRPQTGHICAPVCGFRTNRTLQPSAMVSKDRIKEEEMTQSEVMDKMTAQPKEEVEIAPEWEEYPEEAPGENLRVEEDTLVWERDGFEARLKSHEVTHWRAEVEIPQEVGSYFAREIDMQCGITPESGFVKRVEIDEYRAQKAVVILSAVHQPVWEVNRFIDDLIQFAEGTESYQEELEEKLNVAAENED